jgi:carboxypeptidase C (cathepsin A)
MPETRELLGIEIPGNFSGCSEQVGRNFNKHMDKYSSPTQYYVSGLLERGIRVLIYLGTYDWQCNASANKLWIEKLQWTGQKSYLSQAWRNWLVDGKIAGETKTSGMLTVATVKGAGHMMSTRSFSSAPWYLPHFDCHVPHDKPVEAQALVSRWLAHQEL